MIILLFSVINRFDSCTIMNLPGLLSCRCVWPICTILDMGSYCNRAIFCQTPSNGGKPKVVLTPDGEAIRPRHIGMSSRHSYKRAVVCCLFFGRGQRNPMCDNVSDRLYEWNHHREHTVICLLSTPLRLLVRISSDVWNYVNQLKYIAEDDFGPGPIAFEMATKSSLDKVMGRAAFHSA